MLKKCKVVLKRSGYIGDEFMEDAGTFERELNLREIKGIIDSGFGNRVYEILDNGECIDLDENNYTDIHQIKPIKETIPTSKFEELHSKVETMDDELENDEMEEVENEESVEDITEEVPQYQNHNKKKRK